MSDRPLATSYTSSQQASAVIGTSHHHHAGATTVPATTYSTAGYTSTIPTTTTYTTYGTAGTTTSGTYGTSTDEILKRAGTGTYTTPSHAHGGLATSGYTSGTHGVGHVPAGSYTSYAQGGIPTSLTTSVTGYNVTPSYSHSASHDIHHGATGQSGYRTGGTFEIHAVQPTSVRTSEVAKRTTRQSDIRQSKLLAPYRSTMYPEFEMVEDLPSRKNLVDSINFLLVRSHGKEALLASPTKVSIKRTSALSPAEIEFESLHREKYEDGSVYEGQAVHGNRHGKGKITYKDGRVFEGQFENGRATGTGLLRYKTGKVCYEGGFDDTVYEGQGVLQSEAPIPFQGNFNFRDLSQVENHWTKYEGEFRNGKRHGTGTLYLTNGEKFVGEWRDDQISGRGQFHSLNGHVIEGHWENGVWRD